MNRVYSFLFIALVVIVFAGCTKDEEIIDAQIQEYESYIIETVGDRAVVQGYCHVDEKEAGLRIYIADTDYSAITDLIKETVNASDNYLDRHPDYFLNDGYKIRIYFTGETEKNGKPGWDYFAVQNYDENHEITSGKMCSIHIIDSGLIDLLTDYFGYMSYVNCYSYSDEQISKVAETYHNIKVIYVQTQNEADIYHDLYQDIKFTGIRNNQK